MRAVWGVVGASFILGLPLLKGTAAFSATTSIACAGLAFTYAFPIVLRMLFRRSYLEAGPFNLGRSCHHLLFLCSAFYANANVFEATS